MSNEKTEKVIFMLDPLPILKELVSFNTVSKYLKETKDFSILEFIQDFLEKCSFNCEIIEKDGWKQLLAALIPDTDKNDEKIPRILFLGHLDTVPFDKTEWGGLDPLMLTIDEQRQVALGRGAQDCKGNVAALLAAAKELYLSWKNITNEKPLSLYLSFTTDEEIGGTKGAGHLVSLLKKRNELPTAVINIDTTFVPTIRRRGSFTVHVKASPRWIWIESDAIKKQFQIQETRDIVGEEEGPHSAYFIAGCDKHPLVAVAKRFFNNPSIWARSIEGNFLASNIIPTSVKVEAFIGPPSSPPPVFTTTTTTKKGEQNAKKHSIITNGPKEGHIKVNVTLTMLLRKIIPAVKTCFPTERPSIYGISISPNLLTIMANGSIELILDVRAMLSSPQPVMSAMRSTFGDLPGVNIEVKGLPGYLYTKKDELLVQALLLTMEQHGETVIPVERGGTTDSRFFSPLGIPCVEIGANGGNVHGPKEFVDLNSLRKLPSIYLGIVKNQASLLP